MLVQFTVSNYLSFDEEATFSMVAEENDHQHHSHLLRTGERKGRTALRLAAIYGANAAGKSNLIKAISFARDLIITGTRGDQSIPIIPFRLTGEGQNRLSSFEFIFQHQDVTYSYGFRANSQHVSEEWLFMTPHTPRGRESMLFERTTDNEGKTEVEFGSRFYKKNSGKPFLEFVTQGTRRNQLFLTEAFERNVDAVRPIVDWFGDVLVPIPAESLHTLLEVKIHDSQEFTKFVGDFLREAGTGIEGIHTKEAPFNLEFETGFSDVAEGELAKLRQTIANLSENEVFHMSPPKGARIPLVRSKSGQIVRLQVQTVHSMRNGEQIEFSLDAESDGTQRLIHLIPALFLIKNQNKVVIIDELDRRLHPLLCRRFVEAASFCGEESRSQLIFTTHDTNLLDLDLLRRDEIWFVEKDKGGASCLYSLAEFNIRPDLKISKGYLNGRFGAIPFIGDICKLGWTDEADTNVETAG